MHLRIHASISYSFKKKIITMHASLNHSSYSTKSLKIIKKKKKSETIFYFKSQKCQAFTWCWSTIQKQNSGSLFIYIKTLCKAMVINFLFFTLRPFARQWSSISSHRGPLRGNGHQSLYINTLCKAMVIDFLCHIEKGREKPPEKET